MRNLFLTLIFSSFSVFAQVPESTVKQEPANIVAEKSEQNWSIGIENSLVNQEYKLKAGLYLGEHFLLSVSYGAFSQNDSSRGGDLGAGKYVTLDKNIRSTSVAMDLTYFLTSTAARAQGLYVTGGLGRLYSKVDFSYLRYKAYYGTCIFLCPDREVVESESGSQDLVTDYTQLGIGYTWAFKIKKSAMNIYTGLDYLGIVNPQSANIGVAHPQSVGTDLFQPLMASFGMSFSFH